MQTNEDCVECETEEYVLSFKINLLARFTSEELLAEVKRRSERTVAPFPRTPKTPSHSPFRGKNNSSQPSRSSRPALERCPKCHLAYVEGGNGACVTDHAFEPNQQCSGLTCEICGNNKKWHDGRDKMLHRR